MDTPKTPKMENVRVLTLWKLTHHSGLETFVIAVNAEKAIETFGKIIKERFYQPKKLENLGEVFCQPGLGARNTEGAILGYLLWVDEQGKLKTDGRM